MNDVQRLARFAWFILVYTIGVILWGAYVRATGSGAGCGSHWPLCNGAVIPRAPTVETLIEYSHRLTSGLALLAVVALAWWVWRACAPGHPARRGAALSLFFMLTEAAVGAGLVLFQLVADNASMARAMFMAAHLVNTFILVAFLTLTAHWLSGGAPIRPSARPGPALALGLGFFGLILVGMSGAVAALGDTLYPSTSLLEGLRADLSPTSHFLIRLRVLHPSIAILVGLALVFGTNRLRLAGDDELGRRAARAVITLAAVQLLVGFVNVLLLAPVWMQMLHLLLAQGLWIAYVILAASVLAEGDATEPVLAPAARPDKT
jgi:heme A synthase